MKFATWISWDGKTHTKCSLGPKLKEKEKAKFSASAHLSPPPDCRCKRDRMLVPDMIGAPANCKTEWTLPCLSCFCEKCCHSNKKNKTLSHSLLHLPWIPWAIELVDERVYNQGPKLPPNISESCRTDSHPLHRHSCHDSQVAVSHEHIASTLVSELEAQQSPGLSPGHVPPTSFIWHILELTKFLAIPWGQTWGHQVALTVLPSMGTLTLPPFCFLHHCSSL